MTAMDMQQRIADQLKIVEEHVGFENRHDLEGIMRTFGATARYDDEPWDSHYLGRDAVRAFYEDMLRAMPDLHIEVQQRHATEAAVILEVVIRGQHLAPWCGLPATGRRVQFGLCAVFTFDDEARLAGERIYYDRITVLRQLGVLHEPDGLMGRITTVLMHPVTFARIVGRMIWSRRSQ